MKKLRIRLGLCMGAAIAAGIAVLPANAQTYNAANDFSAVSNPAGVWSYGYTTTLGGSFIADTDVQTPLAGITQWRGNLAGDGNPSVSHNFTGGTITSGTVSWLPNQIILHPGPGGQVSILRWTAPQAGVYTFNVVFTNRDTGGATTDVHLLKNNVAFYNGAISGFAVGTGVSQAGSFTVAAGDRIDAAVGFGSNGSFNNDSTGVALQIGVVVPEASTLPLLLMGATSMGALITRRRVAK